MAPQSVGPHLGFKLFAHIIKTSTPLVYNKSTLHAREADSENRFRIYARNVNLNQAMVNSCIINYSTTAEIYSTSNRFFIHTADSYS